MGTMSSLYQKAKANVPGMAGCGTFTTFSHRRKLSPWLKGLKKAGAENTYNSNQSGRVTAISGSQSASELTYYYTGGDIDALFSGSEPPSTHLFTRKIVIEASSIVIYMTNNGTNPIALDMYDMTPRRDMPKANTATDNSPMALWEQGLYFAGAPAGSSPQNVVGASPFQSPLFCQFWKVLKVSKVQIPQGCTHEHRVHWDVNRSVNQSLTLSNDYYFKDMTYLCMAVLKGFPVDDGLFGVSTAPASFDAVNCRKSNWTQISDAESSLTTYNSLAEIRSPNIVNIGSGGVAPVAFA
jgi:hypothetical protein